MSAETFEEEIGGGGRSAGGKKRLSGKKLILFVVLPILVLLGAGAGLFLSGALNSFLGGKKEAAADAPPAVEKPLQPVYHDLPDILVNLRTDGARPTFLKITISLELDRLEDKQAVEKVLPRVIDTFQVYLRELRPDQLQGSAGLIRLREELLSRINVAVRPSRVRDVLFKEMLIQ